MWNNLSEGTIDRDRIGEETGTVRYRGNGTKYKIFEQWIVIYK